MKEIPKWLLSGLENNKWKQMMKEMVEINSIEIPYLRKSKFLIDLTFKINQF
jgi:hypothetical protein